MWDDKQPWTNVTWTKDDRESLRAFRRLLDGSRSRDRAPRFVLLFLEDTHTPFHFEQDMKIAGSPRYFSAVKQFDKRVFGDGGIYETLNELLHSRYFMFVSSDHGHAENEHGGASPLRRLLC